MAKNETRRLLPAILDADRQAAALQNVANYQSANPAFTAQGKPPVCETK